MAKISQSEHFNIIEAYENNLIPMQKLAERYGVTRQTIFFILKKYGIDTKKQRIPVSCTTCGNELLRTKAEIRNKKNHFCNMDCYTAFLHAQGDYIPNRQGQRTARNIVLKYFELQEKMVVHHEDKNNLNNAVWNLKVFANQGDHIRYHRGFEVNPIWDGSKI